VFVLLLNGASLEANTVVETILASLLDLSLTQKLLTVAGK
jgi:hypothetical protein